MNKPTLTREVFKSHIEAMGMERERLRAVIRQAGADFDRIPNNHDLQHLAAIFDAP